MPAYKYVAKNIDGKTVRGVLSSDSKAQLYNMLKQKGLSLQEIKEKTVAEGAKTSFLSSRVKVKDISLFCRQFSTILRAGVPVLKCIDILRKQTENKKMRIAIDSIYETLQKGSILSDAMRQHSDVFPSMLINMVEAGEVSGTLDESLEKMAIHFEKDFKLKQKVKGAMTYPVVICVIAIVAVMVLLTFVIPQFASMFESMGSKLPWTTEMLLAAGNFMKKFWYIVIIVMGGLVGAGLYYKSTPKGRRFIDTYAFKIPVIAPVVKKVMASRFTRTMATMLATGIPLMKALEVTEKIVGNVVIEDEMKKVKEDIMRGRGLSEPVSKIEYFPVMVSQMISIGEESGAIDKMLEKAADYYDEEVDTSISQLVTLLEPAILMIMAGAVGFIVISIVQPMFGMFNAIK